MAIDTNLGLFYNENYPVAGVDQSSQGFRDNFSVLKRAIENLQNATQSGSSIFSISSTIGTGGDVRITVGYRDNALRLPVGSPTVTAQGGMLRHQSGTAQFHDGGGWRTVVTTDAEGGVRLPSTNYLKLPSGFTHERPTTPEDGMIRFNNSLGVVEVYRLGSWGEVGSGASGGITSAGGTVWGILNLLTDATEADHAVNYRTLRNWTNSIHTVHKTKGISSGFNLATNSVNLTAQPFTISLSGEVVGTATVNDLNDVVISTTIPEKITLKDVRDEVGTLVKGTVRIPDANTTTETGITVNYDEINNTLELGVREFDIILTGAVTGTGRSTRLQDVIIETQSDRIRGINVHDENAILGGPQSVQHLRFIGEGVTAIQTGNTADIFVSAGITLQEVRDEVGGFVKGTMRDQFANVTTETGILVNYDAENNTLEIGARDFDINLTGAVAGSGTVSRLGNVTIETTTDRIRGVTAYDEGIVLGLPQTVQNLNFIGGGVTAFQTGNTVNVDVPLGISLQDVRDHVGSFITGTVRDPNNFQYTESGIFVFYDFENNRLEIAPRDFQITLAGAVTGSAIVSRLGNTTITTTTDRVRGVRVFDEGSALGSPESVRNFNFIGNAITAFQTGDLVTITVADGLTNQNVRDVVGTFISGTIREPSEVVSESGIIVNYDQENNRLEIAPRDFSITLEGAVVGGATISRLGNATITTTTDRIRGIQVKNEAVATGLSESVKVLNFEGGGVNAFQVGEEVTITVPSTLTNSDIRTVVGTFIRGTSRDPDSNAITETGIFVNYDAENNALELSPRDFNITLTGAVTGSGLVTRLGNVSIETTTDRIRGIQGKLNSAELGLPETVRVLNFFGNMEVAQYGAELHINVPEGLSDRDVRDEVGTFIKGTIREDSNTTTETGITVNYDSENNTLELGVRDFDINLAGAVVGNATVSRLGNVTITTTTDRIRGVMGKHNNVATGLPESVKVFNFTGSGLTATQSGDEITINVPEGISDTEVRDTVGSFVTGTIRDPNGNTVTESGIIVNYDAENNTLELGVRDFEVALTGAVVGNATVSRLGNVSISTTTDRIRGVMGKHNSVPTGLPESVKVFNFTGAGLTALQSGDEITIHVPEGISNTEVRDTVGSFVTGTIRDPNSNTVTESGIIVNYDSQNNTLELGVRDFEVALTGAVTGSALISRLGNATITTTTDLVRGLRFYNKGSPTGLPQTVREVNFLGNGITVAQVGDTATVTVADGLTNQNVRDIAGTMVNGSNGITTTYNAQNQSLDISARNFTVALTGAVTGSATVTSLGNTTITTSTDRIRGVTVEHNGVAQGLPESVQRFNITGGGATVLQSSNTVTIDIPTPPTVSDIRDTVGTFVQGTVRDPNTNVSSESGIIVNYDSENNTLELSPRTFNVNLTGAVTGTGVVQRLSNVTINTTADYIRGVRLERNGILLGQTIKTINLLGGNATVTGNSATIDVAGSVNQTDVANAVVSLMVGTNHFGITAVHDVENAEIDLALKPLNINLIGAVTGNGTVVYTNGSGNPSVTIPTETGELGIEVRDEGDTGGSVSSINFVGAGVTSSVSIDGKTATVYIPNSPANEDFILVGNGSSNVPNARKFTAGTGILLNDGGPGGEFIISAHNDAIIAKSRIMLNGMIVAERPEINILGSNEIVPEVIDDSENNRVNIRFYGINDGWHRSNTIDCGLITDKYGPSIDMGSLLRGIIETDADMGTL
jgi:hypothetical protein